MTDHPNTDPAYLVPAGLPAEPAKCPACGGTGCPYCGGPEADYHTACFDCPACGGTGQAPADEAILEVVEEPAKPRPSASPCPHCGGQYRYRPANSGEAGFPLCLACGKDTRELPFDPEASDLLDSVSPGESAALIQEVEARTDEASFRKAAAAASERCAGMARDLAELRDRMRKELKLVERQHARYASRAELLRHYLSDDPGDETVPL